MSMSQAQAVVCSTNTLSKIADRMVAASQGNITKRQALNMISSEIVGEKHDFGYLKNAPKPVVSGDSPKAIKLIFDTLGNPRIDNGELTADVTLQDAIELEVQSDEGPKFEDALTTVKFGPSGISLKLKDADGIFEPSTDTYLAGGDLHVSSFTQRDGEAIDPIVTSISKDAPMRTNAQSYLSTIANHFPAMFKLKIQEGDAQQDIKIMSDQIPEIFQTLQTVDPYVSSETRLADCNLYVADGMAHFSTGPRHKDKFLIVVPVEKVISDIMSFVQDKT